MVLQMFCSAVGADRRVCPMSRNRLFPCFRGHCDTVAMLATTVALAPQRSAVRPIRNVGRGHAGAWSARPIYFTAVLHLYTFTWKYTQQYCLEWIAVVADWRVCPK